MTRLKKDDVVKIATSLEDYNSQLVRMTGCSLRELAAHAVAKGSNEDYVQKLNVAVIPMTCGQGVIEGFVESVASIISYLGFNAVITKSRDAGGVAEAVQNGSDILFMADDDRFVAINVKTGKVSDNGEATGKGYVAGLVHMCDGLEGEKVLVIGAGPVGTGAALALKRIGAEVSIYDTDLSASQRLSGELIKQGYVVEIETDLEGALGGHRILVDACPAEEFIMLRHISEHTMIAAPGIPLGIEALGVAQLSSRLLHDPLQIGVATMMFDVL
ncbi:3-methylornithyl-N6-L-lysine dehydrogenase PylD [Desulfosporosinus fructosivorans]|uniref:3-methylornithyl-N6-L-lysine dehydrogenase PylD n=1 Tax=Desulfosporosinus fructosivorans TaxID=2018669 RepID=A0A4Z0QXI5_9FIRM|nr:3-methylornithyl-N6-L-lysine dehydrogenase PylD [Desulfosporosinus fructosivorans]TGE35039.1 3-methylornithyl-N6-L-lysine dehydrogenase PylD [Desulfosporosinus fructosivorans]